MGSLTYRNLKTLIENDKYERDDMLHKLEVFKAGGRITEEEYNELKDMVNSRSEQG